MEYLKEPPSPTQTGTLASPRTGLDGVIRLAQQRYGEPLTLADLAVAAGMPTNSLTRLFNRRCGMSPMRWLWSLRVAVAAEMITADPRLPLSEVAPRCGFASAAHFSRRFREALGVSPSRLRASARATASGDAGSAPGAVAAALARLEARYARQRPR